MLKTFMFNILNKDILNYTKNQNLATASLEFYNMYSTMRPKLKFISSFFLHGPKFLICIYLQDLFCQYNRPKRACYRVWEINMGVCPRMEVYEIMCINCLGYDCYNNGVFPCKFNSTGKL